MIAIHSDYSDMFKEFDRVESMPTPAMAARLDAVLDVGFNTSRALVHVITGALKGSGKKSSKVNHADWKGEFSFGEGLDYAIYEKERDGGHDFFAETYILKSMFTAALKGGLSRHG